MERPLTPTMQLCQQYNFFKENLNLYSFEEKMRLLDEYEKEFNNL